MAIRGICGSHEGTLVPGRCRTYPGVDSASRWHRFWSSAYSGVVWYLTRVFDPPICAGRCFNSLHHTWSSERTFRTEWPSFHFWPLSLSCEGVCVCDRRSHRSLRKEGQDARFKKITPARNTTPCKKMNDPAAQGSHALKLRSPSWDFVQLPCMRAAEPPDRPLLLCSRGESVQPL